MAKKNIASLMNGIMGDVTPQESEDTKINEHHVSEVTEEMKENLEAKRRQNVGRPKKGESSTKSSEIRATFIVEPEVVRKLKYISLAEGSLLKDVIAAALSIYIDSWETDNGKIRLPKLK